MLAMMRPMMSRLFPILMAGMMPRVMPEMLAAVAQVEPGKLADWVVLDAGPQTCISAVRQVHTVIKASERV